jgi:hypothetical protein
MILRLAKNWKFTKTEAGFLQDSVSRYYRGVYPFHSKNVNRPLDFWLSVQKTPESDPLKKLAIVLLEIVPHAAGVKGLFSMMNAIKTKSRNRLSPTTLKMIAQVKLHLLQGDPMLSSRNKKRRKNPSRNDSEYKNMLAYDTFLTPAELESFEQGVFSQDQDSLDVVNSRENAFIETLFNFDLFESNNQQPTDKNDIILVDGDEGEPAEELDWNPEDFQVS